MKDSLNPDHTRLADILIRSNSATGANDCQEY